MFCIALASTLHQKSSGRYLVLGVSLDNASADWKWWSTIYANIKCHDIRQLNDGRSNSAYRSSAVAMIVVEWSRLLNDNNKQHINILRITLVTKTCSKISRVERYSIAYTSTIHIFCASSPLSARPGPYIHTRQFLYQFSYCYY